ncbi:VOC family protein [Kitasatospora sp. NPDC089797]|uniref:VOC family protein n=1 Tax=Kitasatospora sp. NPDC089797 TaxID=3155298 RepID=UPI00343C140A
MSAVIRKFQVTFDAAQPERLGRFWCEVLGYTAPPPKGFDSWEEYRLSEPEEKRDSWFALTDPSGEGPRIYIQRVPEGKTAKNRLHLDVRVGTGLVGEERLAVLEAEATRLEALGAVRVQVLYDGTDSCISMQDVEGNEFCVD